MIKRFLTIQTIKNNLKGGHLLSKLFKADGLIFLDELSSDVYRLYVGGMSEKQIIKKIKDWNV